MAFFGGIASQATRLRRKTEKQLEEYNRPSSNFFILISFASALAVLGLALDNSAIVIGAMVVAPIITPIFGLALGLILARMPRIWISFVTILLGTLASIIVTTVISILVMWIERGTIEITSEILARTKPDLLFFLVALLSGMIGAFAHAKQDVVERIAGIAMSVAIIPPLAVVGIGIASSDWTLMMQSFSLYLFNLLGILFGSILMFVAVGFGKEIDKK